MLSDSISARTLLLLFLDAVGFFAALNNTCISARTLLLLFLNCITTMHMNYSLFVLHLICHIRQNNSLAVSLQFCSNKKILYHHNAYELFTLHSSFFT